MPTGLSRAQCALASSLPAPDTARCSTTTPSRTSAPRRPRTRAFGWAWLTICA